MKEHIHVKNTARLARIELTGDEILKLEQELAGILDFVNKLNELNTDDIPPLTGGTNLENVMRDDAPSPVVPPSNQPSELVDVAPEKRGGYVRVKQIFDRS